MGFYSQTHQHVCGIDLHTKTVYLCILNESGDIVSCTVQTVHVIFPLNNLYFQLALIYQV